VLNVLRYADVRDQIQNADQLLFRRQRRKLISCIICAAGRGDHSHAAKAVWWTPPSNSHRPVLLCCEVREFKGGRAVTLSSQVHQYDQLIDVYRPNPENRWPQYDPDGSAAYMLRLAGQQYNYAGIWRAALLHLPFTQLWATVDVDDASPDGAARFCSQACSEADRVGGGVDPVPHLADSETEPADLARSPFYLYKFTLSI
jgi:hypothetical protein